MSYTLLASTGERSRSNLDSKPQPELAVSIPIATSRVVSIEPRLKKLVELVGYPTFSRYDDDNALSVRDAEPEGRDSFSILVKAIANQQLSSKAASTILARLRTACAGVINPDGIVALGPEGLRPLGFSGSKSIALFELATNVIDRRLILDGIDHLTNEEIIVSISSQRGLGKWSAEMFLIFHLGRLDVWPIDDLGVRKGYSAIFGLEELVKPKVLDPLGERFRPYRSILAWYCWAAVDQGNELWD